MALPRKTAEIADVQKHCMLPADITCWLFSFCRRIDLIKGKILWNILGAIGCVKRTPVDFSDLTSWSVKASVDQECWGLMEDFSTPWVYVMLLGTPPKHFTLQPLGDSYFTTVGADVVIEMIATTGAKFGDISNFSTVLAFSSVSEPLVMTCTSTFSNISRLD